MRLISKNCTHRSSLTVRPRVRHGKNAFTLVLQFEVFVVEATAVNALASGSVVIRKITTLTHELRNDAMKARSLETKALLASAESSEVFSCAD